MLFSFGILFSPFSAYTDLISNAKEDNVQQTVEEFLTLHSRLNTFIFITNSSSTNNRRMSDESIQDSIERRRKQAASWIHAAVATNMSIFTVFSSRHATSNLLTTHQKPDLQGSRVAVILESNNGLQKKTRQSIGGLRVGSSMTRLPNIQNTQSQGEDKNVGLSGEWVRGNGFEAIIDLCNKLRVESEEWFIGFVERFLDSETSRVLSGNCEIAVMLSQLKRLNDWVDEIDDEDEGVSAETLSRLRHKIYEHLLINVESAAAALEGTTATKI